MTYAHDVAHKLESYLRLFMDSREIGRSREISAAATITGVLPDDVRRMAKVREEPARTRALIAALLNEADAATHGPYLCTSPDCGHAADAGVRCGCCVRSLAGLPMPSVCARPDLAAIAERNA